MLKYCQLFLGLLAPVIALGNDNQPAIAANPALSASQIEPLPRVSDSNEALVFDLSVDAQCPESQNTSALYVMVADTVSKFAGIAEDEAGPRFDSPLEISVPATQLVGLQSGLLCRRAVAKGLEVPLLELPGAFSAQISFVCEDNEHPKTASIALPLAVAIDCAAHLPTETAPVSPLDDATD